MTIYDLFKKGVIETQDEMDIFKEKAQFVEFVQGEWGDLRISLHNGFFAEIQADIFDGVDFEDYNFGNYNLIVFLPQKIKFYDEDRNECMYYETLL